MRICCRPPMNPGSSPHTRGTRIPRHPSSPKIRFIPACAGNAGSGVSSSSVSPVHPRMRGERSAGGRPAWACLGSSPHARGTRQGVPPLSEALRFIPACAGNAGTSPASAARHSVHPRMRGERLNGLTHITDDYGSSPHARGTHIHSWHPEDRGRFIPACAGNAASGAVSLVAGAVHPRMRGERGPVFQVLGVQLGSSPHARGTPLRAGHLAHHLRFIPACAGNAFGVDLKARRDVGSSPHARGTHQERVVIVLLIRFIPACAGYAAPRR